MPGMMIIAHAPLASSLKAVAEHAFADGAHPMEALDVTPDMQPDEIERRARAMLARVRTPEALIFTDVFGATPSNVAQRLADGVQVKVIAGVNVPMLWRSICYADEPLNSVIARAMAGATQGVMQVASTRPQSQPILPGFHDQVDVKNQQ
jgi:PTS system mannose-specific IIA component